MSSRVSTNPKKSGGKRVSKGPGGRRNQPRRGASNKKKTTNAPLTPANNNGMLKFYTEDAPGLKMFVHGPETVLVLSLIFIGFVVLLHIWGKFRG